MDSSSEKALKFELRRMMRARRKRLTADEKSAADSIICQKLAAMPALHKPGDVCCTTSPLAAYLAARDEIDIDAYLGELLQSGVDVVVPRWNGESYELARLHGLLESCLRRGPMGIREPRVRDIVSSGDVRAWIVPGLAFTSGGGRLGYGGGWYDRLLAAASKDSVKIGVAYSFQVLSDIPSEPHDVALSCIVDETLKPKESL